MNKFHIGLFAIIVAVFIGIIVTTEEGSVTSKEKGIPTLSPNGSSFQLISPTVSANLRNMHQEQSAQGQTQQAPAVPMYGPIAASVSAIINTSKGDIYVTLYGDVAPISVRNFITKAESNYYVGLDFHRVEDWVVQGGDPNGNGTGGGEMPTEVNQRPFVVGSLGVARGYNPQISNDSQFFITKTDAPWLDGQYTNFGIVTSGMDVVDNIQVGDKILGIAISH